MYLPSKKSNLRMKMFFLVGRLGSPCAAAVGGYIDFDDGIEGRPVKKPVVTLDQH